MVIFFLQIEPYYGTEYHVDKIPEVIKDLTIFFFVVEKVDINVVFHVSFLFIERYCLCFL